MVSIQPCQGRDGSSILLTCSIDESVRTFRTLIYRKSIERLVFLLLQRNHPKGRMMFMINIIKQEMEMEKGLKQRLEFICNFCKTTPTFINGSIRKIDKSNLQYVEPHRIIIKDITFLAFNYSNDIYIKNLSNKIKLTELENYLNNIK